jgi:hypothetical protein
MFAALVVASVPCSVSGVIVMLTHRFLTGASNAHTRPRSIQCLHEPLAV